MKRAILISSSILILTFLSPGDINPASVKDQIRFGAEMAKKGNWLEAIFRWEKALEKDPENYRLHNNLAVAFEALGRYEEAEKEYDKALISGKQDRLVRENHGLFMKFYSRHKDPGKESRDEKQSQEREGSREEKSSEKKE